MADNVASYTSFSYLLGGYNVNKHDTFPSNNFYFTAPLDTLSTHQLKLNTALKNLMVSFYCGSVAK